MSWPTLAGNYDRAPGHFEAVQETLGRLAAAIAEHEQVVMMAEASLHPQVARLCGPKVRLLDVPTNDMWARDSGPVFVIDGKGGKALVDLNLNGWGEKQEHGHDSRVVPALARELDLPRIDSGVVGEGGGIEFDGEGTLLLTDSCWLNDNRNPGRSRGEIETALKSALGVETVIWLPGVRGLDVSDGHIDGVVRFIRPGLVLMSGFAGADSDWGRTYDESKAILQCAKDAKGRNFEIAEAPPPEVWRSREPGFFTSYANFYVGNGAVYTPEFGDRRADTHAAETLGRLFPGRRVIQLNVDHIYENDGGIHCVTQQEPAA